MEDERELGYKDKTIDRASAIFSMTAESTTPNLRINLRSESDRI
jgi:hypothetical protein